MKRKCIYLFIILAISSIVNAQTPQPIYTGGSVFNNGFARVTTADKAFYIDTTGKYAFDEFSDLMNPYYSFPDSLNNPFPADAHLVIKGKKFGVVTETGKWILAPLYDKIDNNNSSRYFWKVIKDGKANIVTAQGFVCPFLYQDVTYLGEHSLAVKQADKWGLYSLSDKKQIIPTVYDELKYCSHCQETSAYLFARKGKKWGVVNLKNEELLPFIYDEYNSFGDMSNDDWASSLYRNNKQLVVNIHTKEEKECGCDCEDDFAWGFKRQKRNEKFGLINADGKLILDDKYDYISNFINEDSASRFIQIRIDSLYGIADSTGRIIAQPQFDTWPSIASDQLFRVEMNGKTGLLDTTGKMAFPPILTSFNAIYFDSLVLGSTDGTYNYMLYALNGKALFNDAYSISKGISYNEDTTGIEANLFLVSQADKKGFYNAKTGALVKPQYNSIACGQYGEYGLYNNKNLIKISTDSLSGLMDENGKLLMPLAYTQIGRPLLGYPNLISASGNNNKEVIFNLETGSEVLSVKGSIYQLNGDSSVLRISEISDDRSIQKEQMVSVTGKTIVPWSDLITILDDRLVLQYKKNDHDKYNLVNYKTGETKVLPYMYVWGCRQPGLLIVAKDTTSCQLLNVYTNTLLNNVCDLTMATDYDGQEVAIPGITNFINGYAIVNSKRKRGLVDTIGKIVLPIEYDDINYLNDQFWLLQKEQPYTVNGLTLKKTQYGFATKEGKILIPVEYDMPSTIQVYNLMDQGYFKLIKRAVNEDGYYFPLKEKQGIADTTGKIIIPTQYDNIIIGAKNSGFIVAQNNKWGILNKAGKEIVPCKYDDIFYQQYESIQFPQMVKQGDMLKYITEFGKELPVSAKEIVSYDAQPQKQIPSKNKTLKKTSNYADQVLPTTGLN